jgi:small-conductance mechanosensitive channel
MSNKLIPILLIVVISIALVLLFSLLKTLLPFYFKRFKEEKRFRKLLYYTEIIGGMLVLGMFAGYLYQRSTVTAFILIAILLLVIFFIGIFFIKDYVAGLIVKASANYSLNDIIISNGIEGKIVKLGQRSLIITTSDGNKVFLPYSDLVGKIKSIKSASEIKNNYNFSITVKNDIEIEKIKNFIITLPWVNTSVNPEIKISETNENNYVLNISIVAFDNSYYTKIESAVRKSFEKKS